VPETTVRWLWPGVLPYGHLTLVAGEPNSGKTFWMTDLAARVTFQRPWPYAPSRAVASKQQTGAAERAYSSHHAPRDESPRPQAASGQPHAEHEDYGGLRGNPHQGAVVFVNSDDAMLDVQRPRLAAANAQMTHVGLMRRMPPGSRFSQFNAVGPIEERLRSLKTAIQEAGDCKLAIVDDLARFVRDGLGKVTRADLMLALENLRCLAAECDVAMVVVWRLERTGRATARYLETFLPTAGRHGVAGGQRSLSARNTLGGAAEEPVRAAGRADGVSPGRQARGMGRAARQLARRRDGRLRPQERPAAGARTRRPLGT
jgi:hypothetical protein